MTQEEKAKAYDEAIKRAKKLQENSNGMILNEWLIGVFPELAESEDERIRKRIIHALHGDVLDMEETNKAIAWIEKQGELSQSVTKISDKGWSEEDEKKLGIAVKYLQQAGQWNSATWLKSLKTRIVDIEHERYYKNDI